MADLNDFLPGFNGDFASAIFLDGLRPVSVLESSLRVLQIVLMLVALALWDEWDALNARVEALGRQLAHLQWASEAEGKRAAGQ